jgi:putative transposase
VHLTLRARRGLPSFRSERLFAVIREAIGAASGASFRVVHFSVQSDHLHLMVEAADAPCLSSGTQGLAVRTARAINRVVGRRGAVWGDRYHARPLSSAREVRHGLVYVIMNVKKHRPGWRGPAFAVIGGLVRWPRERRRQVSARRARMGSMREARRAGR